MSLTINAVQTVTDWLTDDVTRGQNLTDVWNDNSLGTVDWLPLSCLVIGLVGFLSNMVVSIVLFQRLKGKVHAKRYLLSFTLGNAIQSLAAVSFYVLFRTQGHSKNFSCKSFVLLYYFGYYIYIQSLTLMALERFCAIKFPIYYKRLTSQKNVRIHLASIWLVGLMLTIYPSVNYQVRTVPGSSGATGGCDTSNTSALRIYNLVFDLTVPVFVFLSLTLANIVLLKKHSVVAVTGGARKNSRMKQQYIYLSFIAAMFVSCYGLYFIHNLILLVSPAMYSSTALGIMTQLVDILSFLFSWINPIMHWVCDARFRDTLIGWTPCIKARSEHDSHNSRVFAISN